MLKRFVLVLAVALSGFMGSACADSSGQFIATDPTPLVAATAKGPVAFSVEIADDPGERERGLMFREDLPDNHGMLFVFDQTGQVGFWMKNTPMALDLIFIDPKGMIAAVRRGEPESVAVIAPDVATRYVLELEAGTAARAGLKTGVLLQHPVIAKTAGPG
jgi:uncharacterized membrane protein (UPF0127 family)